MALVFAGLAAGQLPAAKGTLYTSVATTAVKQITLVANAAGAFTANVYYKPAAGSSRLLIPKDIPMDNADLAKAAQIECLEDTLEMSAGDLIEGDASSATSIDFVITGATR